MKYSVSGIAMRTASIGIRSTSPPFRLNIATMVNSSAARVIGLIAGRNFSSYQRTPLRAFSHRLVRKPARNGMPR
ncbi:hypothetical protein D3C71_1814440 [compost metagenome]